MSDQEGSFSNEIEIKILRTAADTIVKNMVSAVSLAGDFSSPSHAEL